MVIDTMVFAYALLRVENKHEQAVAALEEAGQIIVPDSLFAELGNVVWQWIQFRQLPLTTGLEMLADAEALVDKVVPTAWTRELALELAVQAGHSFYDTLFVAAAIQEKTQLVTFDRKLAAKFPDQGRLLE
ncbi:PIN domain-containing protein [Synechococcales cyanobacterium C]|uniref:Ribonuclease VapC n=1 Tax=Petrachloros mirabilis ULC683 TaxID=2781853 RepID=A0A8K2A079_9CYAN|nr:type II toxin-antitoxin system VapC family toxin [Petrachloros mirabilis]NCJ08073.1 PIN domain-containing protein [Petrachloros mirabilis ULC683]